ncbi:MAG: hypothetical protein ACTHMK_13845 [Dyella sp.]|uniref:hypothetical protein n=1 Tax=Dyella sp. TaxID=1869338 RepID=UPI003F7DA303
MSAPVSLPLVRSTATPGPWAINKSFNGYRITRRWSTGFYQRARTGWLKTMEQAQIALAALNEVKA